MEGVVIGLTSCSVLIILAFLHSWFDLDLGTNFGVVLHLFFALVCIRILRWFASAFGTGLHLLLALV